MATFLMLGKYTTEGIKGASAGRTDKIISLVEKCGGKVESMHALLGGYDLAFFVSFRGTEDAMKASFEVGKATGIGFATQPAITVREFDKLIGG